MSNFQATNRQKAYDALENLRANGIQDSQILDYLVSNFFSGEKALQAMEAATDEFGLDEINEEEEESSTICGACGGDASICDGC